MQSFAGGVSRVAEQLVDRQKRNGLRWAASLFGPKAAAALASTRLDSGNFRPGRDTVLCLTRPHFARDVEQLRNSDALNWIALNLIMLGEMQRAWARPEMQQQTFFQVTTTDPRYASSWSRMNQFALELLLRVDRNYRIGALLCANIDYWQSEAFRHAARRLGLPFLVLSRENLVTRHTEKSLLERYRGFHFTGDAVAVFSQWMRDTLLRAGCIREDQIVVTGAPRLDAWGNSACANVSRDCVVLITFADPNYYAPDAYRLTFERFLAAAARCRNRDVRFVIKAKNREDQRAARDMCGNVRPASNVEITSTAPLESLLPRARFVVGFNSMALFDALFAAVPIAAPDMLDSRRGKEYLMFDPDDSLCRRVLNFYRRSEELDKLLDAASNGTLGLGDGEAERRALINRFVHLPDNTSATQLVERFVIEHLRPATSQSAQPLSV